MRNLPSVREGFYFMIMKKMLLVFAHPVDESFAVGGTVAKYVKAGWQTEVLCATSLGYSYGKLSLLTPGTLEDPIYRAMESGIPNVVITFDPTGISNHPDHTKICFAATYAFQKYALWLDKLRKKYRVYGVKEEQWLKRLESFLARNIEPKLYYVCVPSSVVRHDINQRILPAENFGKPLVGVDDKLITTVIDIRSVSAIKLSAIKAHESEFGDVDQIVQSEGNPFFDQEYFIQRMQGTEEIFMGKLDSVSNRL